MKTLLATLSLVTPSALLAHGAHPPVAAAVHDTAHTGMWVGIAVIALALVLGVWSRVRS